jgi:hypothetical protein
MAKAYERLRRERTERRLKNQSFMEPSKRPLQGKRKKEFIRSLFARSDDKGHPLSPSASASPINGRQGNHDRNQTDTA